VIRARRDDDIHREEGGWFHARWHFSFGGYRDPDNEGLGPLRVFNDDRLEPGAVWPMHPHKDVEGITYVVEGSFRHQDSLGNDGELPPGSVQRMTLGSGAYHSEQNASADAPMRFLQLWILPDQGGLPPENEQRVYTRQDRTNRLLKVLGPEGGDVVKVHQDAAMYVASLEPGTRVVHPIAADHGLYVYLIEGDVELDATSGQVAGEKRATGDAGYVLDQPDLAVRAVGGDRSELVVVDVPLQFEPAGVWAR
jgi:redox-sensitive bicupin YhaK (pirin superfamily)